jgi:uncharacterized membrane protein YhfC
MVTAVFVLAILLMLIAPLVISFTLVRRYQIPWMIFGIGGLAFLVAEIVHAPVTDWLNSNGLMPSITSSDQTVYAIIFSALLLSIFQTATRYAGFRLASKPALTWGGGVIVAIGFAALNVVLVYGLQALLILVSYSTFPSTAPEGMTPAQFAAFQTQVDQFWNSSLLASFVQTQLIPGLWQFTLSFAVTLVVWVGVMLKKWLWIISAFLFEVAMVSVFYLVSYWMELYLLDAQANLLNVVVGSVIFIALMAFNLGIVYVIYKKVSPLAPALVAEIPRPGASKPAPAAFAPKEKPAQGIKPAKKLKNTDLK